MHKRQIEYIECECDCADHTMRFMIDEYDTNGVKDLYMEVQMRPYYSFFRRVWLAIKYIFGYQCKYGHWDCVLIKKDDRMKIAKLMEKSLEPPTA